MVFDGRGWQSSELSYPAQAHPHATHVGTALSRPLLEAYVVARTGAAMLLDQPSAIDYRRLNQLDQWPELVSNNYATIAECYRSIPLGYTHLVGEVLFVLPSSNPNAEIRHRLSVSTVNASATDVGDERITVPPPFAGANTLSDPRGGPLVSPYDDRIVLRANFEVALRNVISGAVRRIWLDAYARTTTNNTALAYVRHYVGVWAEIRDA